MTLYYAGLSKMIRKDEGEPGNMSYLCKVTVVKIVVTVRAIASIQPQPHTVPILR